jgi:hypothetical protein
VTLCGWAAEWGIAGAQAGAAEELYGDRHISQLIPG